MAISCRSHRTHEEMTHPQLRSLLYRTSEKDRKMNETIETLKRLFNGVHGRITDVMRPIHKKYRMAVMAALGSHNMDAIVTETEKTATECIRVSGPCLRWRHVVLIPRQQNACSFFPVIALEVDLITSCFRVCLASGCTGRERYGDEEVGIRVHSGERFCYRWRLVL